MPNPTAALFGTVKSATAAASAVNTLDSDSGSVTAGQWLALIILGGFSDGGAGATEYTVAKQAGTATVGASVTPTSSGSTVANTTFDAGGGFGCRAKVMYLPITGSGTLTARITRTAGTVDFAWIVVPVLVSNPYAIGAVGTIADLTGSSSMTVTLDAAPASTSLVLMCLLDNNGSASVGNPTGTTELSDTNIATFGFTGESAKMEGSANQANQFTGMLTTTFGKAAISVEITSAPPAPAAVATPITIPRPRALPDVAIPRGSVGTATSNTSDSTLAITSLIDVEVDDFILIAVAGDNAGTSGAARTITAADNSSQAGTANTYVTTQNNRTAASAANDGTTATVVRCNVTRKILAGNVITLTFSGALTAKAATAFAFRNVLGPNISSNTATGATATPSAAATPTFAGQLVFGLVAVEGGTADTFTEDTDTTTGSWVSLTRAGIGTTTAGQTINAAYKVVTASGVQTYNPTLGTARDWAEIVQAFQFIPVVVTPGAVGTPVGIPAPTITTAGPVIVTPAAVATPVSVPTPTAGASATPTPAAVGTPITIPAPKTQPIAPTGLTPTAGVSQVALSWTAPSSNGGSAVTDYVVQYRPAAVSDQFAGSSLDSNTWIAYNRLGDQANSEVNAVIPANARVTAGSLFIDSKFETVTAGDTTTGAPNPRTVNYTSAQVAEPNPRNFRYGTVQVRAKIAGGTGTWPCIWMLGENWQPTQPFTADDPAGQVGWPTGGWWECDIAEFISGHRTLQNCALHFVTANRGGSGEKTIPFDATSRFMVYRLEWTATSMVWKIDAEDGNGFQTLLTISGVAGTDIPNTPGFLIIHTAVGGFGGTPNSATFPVSTEVDWAEITPDWITFSDGTSTTTSATVTGLSNSAPYEFRVAAVNAVGQGPWSSVASATPVPVTPAAVATPVGIPAPTIRSSPTVTPAAVGTPVTIPAPVVVTSPTILPAAVATPVGIPAPTIRSSPTVTPAAVATPVTIPAAVVAAGTIAQPAAVATPVTIPAPTITSSPLVAAAVVATPVVVPAPTITSSPTVQPAAVATPVAIPAASISAGAIPAPAAVATPVVVPLPTVTSSPTITVAVVATPVAVPATVVLAGGGGTATPAAVATPVTIPALAAVVSATAIPAAVATPVSVAAVTITATGVATPPSVATPVAIPAVLVTTTALVTPVGLATPVAIPAPTILAGGGATVNPAAVATPVTIPPVGASGSAIVTPGAVQTPVVVPQPTVTSSPTASPAVVALFVVVPSLTAVTGALTTPGAVGTPVVILAPLIGAQTYVSAGVVATPVTIVAPTITSAALASPGVVPLQVTIPYVLAGEPIPPPVWTGGTLTTKRIDVMRATKRIDAPRLSQRLDGPRTTRGA